MKIINSMWATMPTGQRIGVVVTENETTGERKLRAGALPQSLNHVPEDAGAEKIGQTGGKVSIETLKEMIAQVEVGQVSDLSINETLIKRLECAVESLVKISNDTTGIRREMEKRRPPKERIIRSDFADF